MRTALILAGGFGTRLRSVVPDVPKPMATVAGKPFLTHILDLLVRQQFTHVVLSVGYKANSISSYFGSVYANLELSYSLELSPLGTGGAISSTLPSCRSDPVFVLNGDTYADLDYGAIYSQWMRCEQPVLVGRQIEDTGRYDALVTSGGQVTGLARAGKGGPGIINAGCYLLPRNLFEGYPLPRAFSFERDFLARTLEDRPFSLYVAKCQFIDIGVPVDYQRAQLMFSSVT